MPLSRQWYDSKNKALADTSTALRSHASQWHNFMRQITGASHGTSGPAGAPPASADWSVHSSHACGVAAGAGNNFSAAFVASEWLRAAAGSSHAWIVFESPATITDGPVYLTISLGTSSDQNAVIKISKTAPSGGTTTADPTSATEVTYGTSQQTHPNTTTAGKTHLVMDADGNFYFFSSKNGGAPGYCHFFLSVCSLVNTAAGDSNRFMLACQYLDSGRGVPSCLNTISVRGLHYDGSAGSPTSSFNIGYIAASGSTSMAQQLTQLNAANSKVDGIEGGWVFDTLTSFMGVRGQFPDFLYCTTGAATGAGDPSGVAPTRVVYGGAILPSEVVPAFA